MNPNLSVNSERSSNDLSVLSAAGFKSFHPVDAHNDSIRVMASQRGAVLITGLIFLMILMLLATTTLRGTLLEEKMAGNLRDETLAFQAAEAALRSGERFLEQVTIPEFNGSDGLYHRTDAPAPDPTDMNYWNDGGGREVEVTMDGVADQPRYFIEFIDDDPPPDSSAQQSGTSPNASVFRIVAQGRGGTHAAVVLLQSTYRR